MPGVHMNALVQTLLAEQSALTRQPPEGSHSPLTLHAPERHTTSALELVHGPSSLG
jgi:hypothetical protein